jgi:hypothetical protein
MNKWHLFAVVLLITSCSRSGDEQSSSPNDPKTTYGQSVKKARDLQKPTKQADENEQQTRDLMSDTE